jgi:hypothetical protein
MEGVKFWLKGGCFVSSGVLGERCEVGLELFC